MQDDFRPARSTRPAAKLPADQRPAHRLPVISASPPPIDPPKPLHTDDEEHDLFAAKTAFIFIIVLFILIAAGLIYWLYLREGSDTHHTAQESQQTSESKKIENAEGLALDPSKNYGDKYAGGILPVGDKKFVTDSAKKGYIYLCDTKSVTGNKAGATTRGPWFVGTTKWNINKKYAVQGNVNWASRLTDKVANGVRTIATNGLPAHMTGTFPITPIDPAYSYDRNPNGIKPQELIYSLSAGPEYGAPQCMGGEAGVILTGVPLLNGFDAGGRDAGAWEVQDACGGHPLASGAYHYHALTSCIKDVSISTVIGFALDGFPITGPYISEKNYLTTSDLDECHGIISEINLDGKKVKTYHYVMTQDFPYSVSCFRGRTSQTPSQQQSGQSLEVNPQGGSSPHL